MKLTPEQQQFWNALHGAPYHCHSMARDILAVKGRAKRFHQRVDQHLDTIMRLYKGDEIIRIVYTWMTVYQLPLDPGRLTTFDLFHSRYGSHVLAIMDSRTKIKPY